MKKQKKSLALVTSSGNRLQGNTDTDRYFYIHAYTYTAIYSCIYIRSVSSLPPGRHRSPSWALCGTQPLPTSCLFYTRQGPLSSFLLQFGHCVTRWSQAQPFISSWRFLLKQTKSSRCLHFTWRDNQSFLKSCPFSPRRIHSASFNAGWNELF